jgi:crotonobetainyl-CoA:carnitine CoA-transferase CaiB-like acyl-CoA transferase
MTDAGPAREPLRPLAGMLVIDVSRMLPGAVLARMLVDLGARVIKVEEPSMGDPMRLAPPLIDGIGAGFCAFFRGTESICLDLRDRRGADGLRKLARSADVLAESFRPGTLEAWSVGHDRLMAANPRLVGCSLSGFGIEGEHASRVGHDLNFVALSGLAAFLPGEDVPRVQVADVTAGVLACNAILAALLHRAAGGRGVWIDQPLVSGPMPLLTWAVADAAAGGGSHGERLLGGTCPAYRFYTCGDGKRIAVCALEPKFWALFVTALGLPELSGVGLDMDEPGEAAVRRIEEVLSTRSRDEWLELVGEGNLPVSAVHDLNDATNEPALHEAAWFEPTPVPGGKHLSMVAPFSPSVGATPDRPAPHLGQHTESITTEFDL